MWVRKLDSNSLTKTKNWSDRNEVIETSGRLHPLWPQDKRLHTPRTADYRHTRQDRWIQTELFSTLAKNATNHTATDHKEGEQLEDRRNVGQSSCNFGGGTDRRVQSLMFMMMMMMMMRSVPTYFLFYSYVNCCFCRVWNNETLSRTRLTLWRPTTYVWVVPHR